MILLNPINVNIFLLGGELSMKIKLLYFKFFCIVLLPVNILLTYIASHYPAVVEHLYSNKLNKLTREILSSCSGIFNFSIGELIILLLLLVFLQILIKLFIDLRKHSKEKLFYKTLLINIVSLMGFIYFIFLFSWGLNYYRQPISKLMNLDIHATSTIELENLCNTLISNANELSELMSRDKNNNIIMPNGIQPLLSKVPILYKANSKLYPFFSGYYCKPKPIIFSKFMSYAGLTGFYFPFTAEPNINTDMPYISLPFTACHETAHQRGFAREDEANFIAFIICNNNNDVIFRYSGNFNALIYSMNALYSYNPNQYYLLAKKYSYNLKHDLKSYNAYWQKYSGPIESLSETVNNAYLKANSQKKGIYSYGQMVDLLLAYYIVNQP